MISVATISTFTVGQRLGLHDACMHVRLSKFTIRDIAQAVPVRAVEKIWSVAPEFTNVNMNSET
jgi:hypothetical protein